MMETTPLLRRPTHNRCPLGLLAVTASALVFGVVACMVKVVALPPLVMLQCRSFVQWALSLASVALCARGATSVEPSPSPKPGSVWPERLFGPPRLARCLALRALSYWAFMGLWWSSLEALPVGDATTIVSCGPLFTSLSAVLFLGERVPRSFVPCLLLDIAGVIAITRPRFLFDLLDAPPSPARYDARYEQGVALALASAFVAGQLPILARLSRACHWSTVEHVTSSLSSVVFTPAALALRAWSSSGGAPGPRLGALARAAPAAGARGFLAGLAPGATALVCAASVVEFVGLGLQTWGFQREDAMRASLMGYLEVPFAYALQYALFKQQPISAAQIGGMLAIVGSAVVNQRASQREGGDADASDGVSVSAASPSISS